MSTIITTPTFLGYENDWPTTPAAVTECREAGHELKTESKECVHTYTCETCNIRWKVDSGD